MKKIVLASNSIRRKQLLEAADIDFDIIVRETGETFPDNLPMEEVPIHIARNKALAVNNPPYLTGSKMIFPSLQRILL